MNSCVNIGGNDKVHAAVSIMGRESLNKQCWECANCKEPTAGWDGSKFRCSFLGKDFGTWHYDVPNECPCKGKGWRREVSMDDWRYPLTNISQCGGKGHRVRPTAAVMDANGNKLLLFCGSPYRENTEAIAMATEFCAIMNAAHERQKGGAK